MPDTSTDRIEKRIELKAPQSRVWRAITDYREFGEWFRVALDAPFEQGKKAVGRVLHPGYEHVKWEVEVHEIRPESLFSFYWHPYAIEPDVDYSAEPSTLVEFRLEPTPSGTLLTLVESGFDALPPNRRDEAFRMNGNGWTQQMKNIERHVDKNA
jgi:uncharacterized protein YndB with AHSA1/START domain